MKQESPWNCAKYPRSYMIDVLGDWPWTWQWSRAIDYIQKPKQDSPKNRRIYSTYIYVCSRAIVVLISNQLVREAHMAIDIKIHFVRVYNLRLFMHIVGEDTLTQTACKLRIINDRVIWHRVAVSVHVHIRFSPPMTVQFWDGANVKIYNRGYTARWITSRMKVFAYMRIGRRDYIINLPHPHMWCLPNVLASYVSNRSMCFQEQGKRSHCFPDSIQFAISYLTQ